MFSEFWRSAFYFLLFVLGCSLLYESLFKMIDFAQNKKFVEAIERHSFIYITISMYVTYLMYILMVKATNYAVAREWADTEFQQYFTYTILFTLLISPVVYAGSAFFNYSYLRQALLNAADSRFSQFMVLLAAPTAYFALAWAQRGEKIDKQTFIALVFVLLGNIIFRWR